ncbi:MAG: DUF1592 domain-containing protein [Polyangiaceae bacterium]
MSARSRLGITKWAVLACGAAAALAFGACEPGGGEGSGSGAGGEGGCPGDADFFQSQVYAPILGQKCVVCHSANGLAKETHMVLDPSGTPEAAKANFEAVRSVARIELNGKSVLLLRPTGLHPDGHAGGKLIDVGSPEYKTLETFVARVVEGQCDAAVTAQCEGPSRGNRMLRRLSRAEYDATIHDLLGIDSTWGAAFGADTVVNGFDNNASALVVSPLLADQVRRAAEEIADAAFESPASLLPCDPATGDEACAASFVDTFGARAFRRPLDASDHDRYMTLYAAVAAEDGFLEGVKTVLTAMLQSPHFLYRTELGGAPKDGVVNLTPHEIASELSYLFWGTMPDAELTNAANQGKLGTPEEIASQAARLLSDPRSDAVLDRFVDQWLLVGNILNVPKDTSVYPGFTPDIRAAMRDEIRAFYRGVLRGEAPTLPLLFTADKSHMSPDLAAFYGLPAGAVGPDGLVTVDLAGTERTGLLGQGALLASHAHPNDSSPIHRGKLVRTRLLCQKLPPPPAGFNVQPPPLDPSLTTRERYIEHSKSEPCKSCHSLMDPIGFGFERFDGVGRLRAEENGKPIDAAGEIVSSPSSDATFDGTAGLSKVLAESPDTGACYALQWVRFAYGIEEGVDTTCLVGDVEQGFSKDGFRLDTLLYRLTGTSHFTSRTADPDQSPEPDPSSGGGGAGGAGQAGSGQGASGVGGSPQDPATPDLTVTVHTDSQWQSGYCDTVTVENPGAAAVTWQISLDVQGMITDLWNAKSSADGAKTKFVGVDYNAVLGGGQAVSFGFCASL